MTIKDAECRNAHDQLVDSIENELDKTQQQALARHLETCANCRAELKALEHLRESLAHQHVPDPGAAFWESFPDRVWQAHQSQHTATTRRDRDDGLQRLRVWLQLALTPRFSVVAATAFTLIVGLTLFFTFESPGAPSIATFQANIRDTEGLALLARRSVPELAAENRYGFSATPNSVNFFRVGYWYAESLAYTAGGDIESARRRLAAMTELLGATSPNLSALARDKPSLTHIAAFEPELIRLAAGARSTALFQAGGQLVNLTLAVAARDGTILRAAAPDILRLRRTLETAGAPPGALRDLAALAELLAGHDLTEREYAQAAALLRDIQLVLNS